VLAVCPPVGDLYWLSLRRQWNFAHFPGSSSLHLAWFSTAALLPSSSPIRVPPWSEIENGECELCSVLAHAGNGGEPEKWGDLSLATFSTTWPRLGFELALAAWNSACPDVAADRRSEPAPRMSLLKRSTPGPACHLRVWQTAHRVSSPAPTGKPAGAFEPPL
jgi:hypothetical protein